MAKQRQVSPFLLVLAIFVLVAVAVVAEGGGEGGPVRMVEGSSSRKGVGVKGTALGSGSVRSGQQKGGGWQRQLGARRTDGRAAADVAKEREERAVERAAGREERMQRAKEGLAERRPESLPEWQVLYGKLKDRIMTQPGLDRRIGGNIELHVAALWFSGYKVEQAYNLVQKYVLRFPHQTVDVFQQRGLGSSDKGKALEAILGTDNMELLLFTHYCVQNIPDHVDETFSGAALVIAEDLFVARLRDSSPVLEEEAADDSTTDAVNEEMQQQMH